MQCKLCLLDKPLIKESHIIPDFLYKELYDEKHSIIRVDAKLERSFSIFNGEYEPNILCKECDNEVLGKLESYASVAFYGGAHSDIKTENHRKPDGLEYISVEGMEYGKFKLFLLSLLWRASISQREFFTNVSLGPHEEKIRRMLIAGDPGAPERYPCIISSYRKRNLPKEVIGGPRRIKLDGTIGYAFLISGFLFMYKISEKEKDTAFLEASVGAGGGALIPHITEEQGAKLLNAFFNKKVF